MSKQNDESTMSSGSTEALVAAINRLSDTIESGFEDMKDELHNISDCVIGISDGLKDMKESATGNSWEICNSISGSVDGVNNALKKHLSSIDETLITQCSTFNDPDVGFVADSINRITWFLYAANKEKIDSVTTNEYEYLGAND